MSLSSSPAPVANFDIGNADMADTDALLCYDMVKTRITRMFMGRDDLFLSANH